MGGSNHTIPGKGVKAPEPAKDPLLEAPMVPIILIPGVMGSNLRIRRAAVEQVKERFREEGREADFTEQAWQPPNVLEPKRNLWLELHRPFTAGPALRQAQLWDSFGPKLRQVLLNPETTEVDPNGELPEDLAPMACFPYLIPRDTAERHGWGTVHWQSYGPFLRSLDASLNPGLSFRRDTIEPRVDAFHRFAIMGKHLGLPDAVLPTRAESRKAAGYRFPVLAFGYNWTRSSLEAAKNLLTKIREWQDLFRKMGHRCDQVILVTHSMGGFVARIATQLDKEQGGNLILGVVHGVMPAIGAPILYRRVVAGWEPDGEFTFYNQTRNMLVPLCGRTGEDTTAVVANAQGVLELLPSHLYPPGWLRMESQAKGQGNKEVVSFPKGDNPYDEIYLQKSASWRMVDPTKLDPAQIIKKHSKNSGDTITTAWSDYCKKIRNVKNIHKQYLNKAYANSDNSFVFYGYGCNSFSEITWGIDHSSYVKWGQVELSNAVKNDDYLGQRKLVIHIQKERFNDKFASLGLRPSNLFIDCQKQFHFEEYGNLCLTILRPSGDGDRTVPTDSGCYPRLSLDHVFSIKGIGHQECLGNHLVRYFVLNSILKIVQSNTMLCAFESTKNHEG